MHRWNRLCAPTMIGLALLCGSPVLAGEPADSERAATAITFPGTAWTFSPMAGTEAGYDSNPDGLMKRVGSGFVKLESGGELRSQSATEAYMASLRVRNFEFEDLERSHRWDLKAAIEGSIDLPDHQTVKAGTSFLRDRFSLSEGDFYKGFVDYSRKGDNFRLRIQGKAEMLVNQDQADPQGIDIDVFNVVRGRAFDYLRSEGQIALLALTEYPLQPFVIYNFADVNYFNQVEDPSIDRNAREQFAIAGVRFQPHSYFRIDLGARLNERRFDDTDIMKFRSTAFDANFAWHPVDGVKITGVVERTFREPSTALGLADDVKTYGLTLDWRLTSAVRVYADGYFDHIAAIGDRLSFDKYTAKLGINYEAARNLELYANVLGRYVREESTSDSYSRYRIGAGARLRF